MLESGFPCWGFCVFGSSCSHDSEVEKAVSLLMVSFSFPLHPFIPAGLLVLLAPALTEALKGKTDSEDGRCGDGIEVHRNTVSCLERFDVSAS